MALLLASCTEVNTSRTSAACAGSVRSLPARGPSSLSTAAVGPIPKFSLPHCCNSFLVAGICVALGCSTSTSVSNWAAWNPLCASSTTAGACLPIALRRVASSLRALASRCASNASTCLAIAVSASSCASTATCPILASSAASVANASCCAANSCICCSGVCAAAACVGTVKLVAAASSCSKITSSTILFNSASRFSAFSCSALASSSSRSSLRCSPFSLAPSVIPPTVPKPPPATAPRTLASMMRSNSLLPKMSGFSSMSRSAAILIDSCAPSVRPSVPSPLSSPVVPDRSTLGFIPDLSSSFLVTSALTGPEIFLAKAAGRTESRAAAAEPNSKAVPGAVSPVSW